MPGKKFTPQDGCRDKATPSIPKNAWDRAEFQEHFLVAFSRWSEAELLPQLGPWLDPLTVDQRNQALDTLEGALSQLRPPAATKGRRGKKNLTDAESRYIRDLFEGHRDAFIDAGMTRDDAVAEATEKVKWWTGHAIRKALSNTKTQKKKRQSGASKSPKKVIQQR